MLSPSSRPYLLVCSALLFAAHCATAAVDVVCGQVFEVTRGSDSLQARYCGNVDLLFDNSGVTRAVIVIHGSDRNAYDYLSYVQQAGLFANGADSRSAIVAPQFLTDEDVDAHGLPEATLYWSNSGWKQGNTSNSSPYSRPFDISSFEVVDLIIERLADDAAYPNLSDVVVIGHSAGGQFTQRYAAGGQAEAVSRSGLTFRYVFANPSSYLYFSAERVRDGTLDIFEVPDSRGCGGYDDYKYGLDRLNSYMGAVGEAGLREQYRGRQTVTLLGEFDNDPDHSSLDNSCSAKLQGDHRLERGRIYFNHTRDLFGSEMGSIQSIAFVPAVGHAGQAMFQSGCGVKLIYDYDPGGDSCGYELVDAAGEFSGNERAVSDDRGGGSIGLLALLVLSAVACRRPRRLPATNRECPPTIDWSGKPHNRNWKSMCR